MVQVECMSLLKSILITIGIFVFIGLLGWGAFLYNQEQKADKTLASLKDLYNKGNYEDVVTKVDENVLFSHREDFLLIKLESLVELGEFYEGETVAKDLLKLNSKNAKCYYFLGLVYYNTSNLTKSIDSFKKAINLQPKNTDYKLNLARTLTQNGNDNEAIKVYKQIMNE